MEQATFDPRKSYAWQKTDVFEITGAELEVLHKAFNTVLADPMAERILMAMEGAKITTALIKRNVEAGSIKEVQIPESKKADSQEG
jgi:hypothetical protein